jgi:hypothetical protein
MIDVLAAAVDSPAYLIKIIITSSPLAVVAVLPEIQAAAQVVKAAAATDLMAHAEPEVLVASMALHP